MNRIEYMQLVKSDPDILGGTLCFSGTRVPVVNLFDYLESGKPLDEFFIDFPAVSPEQARAVLVMARDQVLKTAEAA